MYNLHWLTYVGFFLSKMIHIRGSYFHVLTFAALLLAVSQRVFFMYILTLHCIFLAPIYSRILAFWLMLSVVKTTLNKFYLILSYLLSYLFSNKKSFQNVVYKTVSILRIPQWDNGPNRIPELCLFRQNGYIFAYKRFHAFLPYELWICAWH